MRWLNTENPWLVATLTALVILWAQTSWRFIEEAQAERRTRLMYVVPEGGCE